MLNRIESEALINRIPKYREAALSLARGLHGWILERGEAARRVADIFHGSWLGHPLHPVLTDVVIGAWTFGAIFDLIGVMNGSRVSRQAGDRLTALGAAAAVPTAVAGLADFTTIPQRAASSAAAHGLINVAGLVLYLLSLRQRAKDRRGRGLFLSTAALGLLTVSAWLGGELVYRYRVGVNKSPRPSGPLAWVPVLGESSLPERQPLRVEAQGEPILLYRADGVVYALGAVCSHDGGPLEQGSFDGLMVQCPWHQSVFDLRDGGVVHGPATCVVPSYAVRVREGNVEVRLRPG